VGTRPREIGSPRRYEVLLLRRQSEKGVLSQIPQLEDAPSQPLRRAFQNRRGQRFPVIGADQVAERTGTVELAIADQPAGLPFATELRAEMPQVVEPVQYQPRPEPRLLTHQFTRLRHPAPHHRASISLRPHRYDSRRRIPAP
jgi:hypothetical protein